MVNAIPINFIGPKTAATGAKIPEAGDLPGDNFLTILNGSLEEAPLSTAKEPTSFSPKQKDNALLELPLLKMEEKKQAHGPVPSLPFTTATLPQNFFPEPELPQSAEELPDIEAGLVALGPHQTGPKSLLEKLPSDKDKPPGHLPPAAPLPLSKRIPAHFPSESEKLFSPKGMKIPRDFQLEVKNIKTSLSPSLVAPDPDKERELRPGRPEHATGPSFPMADRPAEEILQLQSSKKSRFNSAQVLPFEAMKNYRKNDVAPMPNVEATPHFIPPPEILGSALKAGETGPVQENALRSSGTTNTFPAAELIFQGSEERLPPILAPESGQDRPNLSTANFPKVLDFAKITSGNSQSLLDQIKNYLTHFSHSPTRSVGCTFNHEILGRVDLKVVAGKNKDLEIKITTFGSEGKEFFTENKNNLINNLTGAGLKVADLKIESLPGSSSPSPMGSPSSSSSNSFSPGDEKTSSQENLAKNPNWGDNRRESARDHSRRLKELWDIVLNKG